MQFISPYTVYPEKSKVHKKLTKQILKIFSKKENAHEKLLIEINTKHKLNILYPISNEQLDKLNQEQMIQILKTLNSPLAEVDIYKWAMTLFDQSRAAYNKFQKIKQFNSLSKDYSDELSVSSSFYNEVMDSLLIAVFILIQRIYEKTEDTSSISIKKLITKCRNNLDVFPEYFQTYIDNECINNIPWQWEVSKNDLTFLKAKYPRYYKSNDFILERVDITPTILIELHEWKYQTFIDNNKLRYLYTQRDKIFVHNDKKAMNDFDKITSDNPLSYQDLDDFIQFSLNFSHMILFMLTNRSQPFEPTNHEDWEETLKYVRKGLEKHESDLQKKREEIENLLKENFSNANK
ncbi:hypothetical protein [Lactococcus garvieae]|uniref:AbiU2 domain-containing protein n=1 Tax=Lactococcus garvieae TaxID=1363 RepID=UPI0002E8FF33|nr:hypothetical protein [Lactococcus garvieae]